MIRRSLLWLLLLLTTASAPAQTQAEAEAPTCTGRNLIDVLSREHPADHARLLKAAASVPNGEALFWKITGKDAATPSWLLGTGHLTDPRVTTLPPETAAALAGASIVAMELKEAGDLAAVQAKVTSLTNAVLLPEGVSLQSRFTPDQWRSIAQTIPDATGLSLAMAQRLRPWLLASAYAASKCEMARREAGLPVLDELIARSAAAAGKPVMGLETIEGQVSAFAGADAAHENAYLLEAVKNLPEVADQQETMAALYAARQTALLLPMVNLQADQASDEARLAAEFTQNQLISPRNRIMHQAMLPLIAAGNAFIAVGALHLPGTDGLVALLRADGYTVTPVN